MTDDEMVGWHHQLDGHEFEQAPGVGDGQGSLARCSSWGRKEQDTIEQPKTTMLTMAGEVRMQCQDFCNGSSSSEGDSLE